MTKSTEHQPQTNHTRTAGLLGVFASATAYAVLLSTKRGRRWADEQTWATVVAGVMLTTGWAALEDRRALTLNFLYFFVAGIPIVVRSLWLQLEKIDAVMQRGAR